MLAESGTDRAALRCVGVAVPGPLDVSAGVVTRPPNLLGWERVPIASWLAEAFGCRVHVENDANAAALAEWRFGAGRGLSDLVYLTMSTGVGGGLILDGHLYRGSDGTAGELGHVPVEWGGELCGCGLRGCLEAYVGGACWTRRLRQSTPDHALALALAGAREQISPVHVVAAAREGDAHALAEMRRFNRYLSRALVQLRFALAPQAILLGTIVAAAGEALCLGPLRLAVADHSWPHQAAQMRIDAAALGDELPLRAGLAVAMQADEPGGN